MMFILLILVLAYLAYYFIVGELSIGEEPLLAPVDLLACGQLIDTPDTVYTLVNDVSSSGTCFTIGADNVTLDGGGKLVNYSQTVGGYAINNTGYDNVTIKNLVIEKGSASIIASYAINFRSADNGAIINNTIIQTKRFVRES